MFGRDVEAITLRATGKAMRIATTSAEILKRRVYNLHQITNLDTIQIKDEYEPIEEGLDKVVIERNLTVLEIILTKKEPEDKENHVGY